MNAPGARVAAALFGALLALSFAAPLFRLAAPTHPLVAAGLRLAMAALLLTPLLWRSVRAGRFPAAHARGARTSSSVSSPAACHTHTAPAPCAEHARSSVTACGTAPGSARPLYAENQPPSTSSSLP